MVNRLFCFRCDNGANRLAGRVRVKVDARTALRLAACMPRPEAATMAVMRAIASYDAITLEQMRMLFGLIAQRALRE